MHSVSINLEPSQYLAGYREGRTLFLPTLSESRVGDEVAVRVGIYGQPIRATLFGKVSLVRRVGRPALLPGVELQLEKGSLLAAGFLALAARGEPVSFSERPPRFVHEQRLVAGHAGATVEAATANVSEGGCALRWPGTLPLVGDEVTLRLGAGFLAPTARGIVCWNQPGGPDDRSVGLRIVPAGRAGRAWRALVATVERSGARVA